MEEEKVKMYVWDTTGQEQLGSITKLYFRGCDGVLLVYDITNQDSFSNTKKWLNEIHEYTTSPQVMLIGNKWDLNNLRTVSTEAAKKFARQHDLGFYETSALDWTNVNVAIDELMDRIYKYQTEKVDEEAHKKFRDEYRKKSFDNRDQPSESISLRNFNQQKAEEEAGGWCGA